MKIKRSVLEKMVREELAEHIKNLLEAESGKSSKATVKDADRDKKRKETDSPKTGEDVPLAPQDDPDNTAGKPKTSGAPVQELPPDPADDELEDSEEEKVPEDGKDPAGDISDELVGKTIQSITMEPKSKMMPGAIEINITFNEVTDTFRILVNKSGVVKFFWRGLHNML